MSRWDLRGQSRQAQRQAASFLLRQGTDGDFFVRDVDSMPGCIGLAVRVGPRLMKFLIEASGGYQLTGSSRMFDSLLDLLDYYSRAEQSELPVPLTPVASIATPLFVDDGEDEFEVDLDGHDGDSIDSLAAQTVVATAVVEDRSIPSHLSAPALSGYSLDGAQPDGDGLAAPHVASERQPGSPSKFEAQLPDDPIALQAHVAYLRQLVKAGKMRARALEIAMQNAYQNNDYETLDALLVQLSAAANTDLQVLESGVDPIIAKQRKKLEKEKAKKRKRKIEKKRKQEEDAHRKAREKREQDEFLKHIERLALTQNELESRLADMARQKKEQDDLLRQLMVQRTQGELVREQEDKRLSELEQQLLSFKQERVALEAQLERERQLRLRAERKQSTLEAKERKEEEWRLQQLLAERRKLEEEAEQRQREEEKRRYESQLQQKEAELRRQREEAERAKKEAQQLKRAKELAAQKLEEERVKQNEIEDRIRQQEQRRREQQRKQEEEERRLWFQQQLKARKQKEDEEKRKEEEARKKREKEDALAREEEDERQRQIQERLKRIGEEERRREEERKQLEQLDMEHAARRKDEIARMQEKQLKEAQANLFKKMNRQRRAALIPAPRTPVKAE